MGIRQSVFPLRRKFPGIREFVVYLTKGNFREMKKKFRTFREMREYDITIIKQVNIGETKT